MSKKYITTTLPYINGQGAHIGHTFEFCLADVITSYYRYKLGASNVFLNVGVDEYGQKIYLKAQEEGFENTQDYCNAMAIKWKEFCSVFQVDYDKFYRTTSVDHGSQARRYLSELEYKGHTYRKSYAGQYCAGCEAFITDKELVDGNKCPTHLQPTQPVSEDNLFFQLSKFAPDIKDILVNKNLSLELKNLMSEVYDLSVTRKNVQWGVKYSEDEIIYIWLEALTNYLFAIDYYNDPQYFHSFWSNSLIICGKDNLKFQAYILQALLLANGIPQTKEILVHGTILDAQGIKMSKTLGNVIDPLEQVNKFGLSPVKYYLTMVLQTFEDSKYSESDLINAWNSEVVNGLGNLISRTLHLIDIKGVEPDESYLSLDTKNIITSQCSAIENAFEGYNFNIVRRELNNVITGLNIRLQIEKPWELDDVLAFSVLNDVYYELKSIIPYYCIVLKEYSESLSKAFEVNKKVIIFGRI